MKSIRCPQCGLANWETSEWCKRCKLILKQNNGENLINSENPQVRLPLGISSNSNQYYKPKSDQTNTKYSTNGKPIYDIENSFVAKNIERCKRNLMIVCILTIVVVAGGFFLNSRYLCNIVLGPSSISDEQMLFDKNLPDSFRNYVKITADEAYDTGATYVEVSKYNVETVKSKYLILQIKDALLLTEVDPNTAIIDGTKNVSINGEIAKMPLTVNEKIVEPILQEQPELRSSLLPFILKAKSDYYYPGYIGTGIGLVLLLVAGIYLWSVLKKLGNPSNSSIMESLSAYGSPKDIAASIDAEIAGQHEKIGSVYLLPTWIVKNNTFSMSIQHVEEVVWMYKKVTKHSVNFIPTGKTYEVVLHNTQGTILNLNGSFLNDKKTDQMLEAIYQRVPWIVTGYDEELVRFWNSDKNSFIQTVGSRRKTYSDRLEQREASI